MSIPGFGWAQHIGAERNLIPSDRLILQHLAGAANAEGICWPGQPTIKKYTGLAIRTIRERLPKLEAAGLIAIIAKVGCATHYRILRPINGVDTAPEPRQDVSRSPRQNVSRSEPKLPTAPAECAPVTPANSSWVDGVDPGNSCIEPRNITAGTPADGCPEPLRSKNNPKTRASAREGSEVLDSDFGRKEVAAAPPVPPDRELTVPEIMANRAKAAADLDALPPELQAMLRRLGRAVTTDKPVRSFSPKERTEHLDKLSTPHKRPIKPAYLPPHQLPWRRAQLATSAMSIAA